MTHPTDEFHDHPPRSAATHPRRRRRHLARLGASALAVALVVPTAAGATTPDPPSALPQPVASADDHHTVRAALFDRLANESEGTARRSHDPGRTTSARHVDRVGECADDSATDTVGDVFALDIRAYAVSSDCDVWAFGAITLDSWELWELEGLVVLVDLDERSDTGCNGADVAAVAIEDLGLFAGMFTTPNCADDSWTYLGDIPVSSRYTNSIALGFPASAIGRDTSFRWSMALESIYGGLDRAPDVGWRAVGVEAVPALASAPRRLAARISSRTIGLTWRAPDSDGGSPITDHVVQIQSRGGGWTTVTAATSARRDAVIGKLVNGRTYQLRVAAVTAAGRGAWSQTVEATPAGAPGSPRSLDARARTRGALVSWRRPADDGGRRVTDYAIQISTNNGRTWSTVSDGRSADTSTFVDRLRPGRRHLIRVAARTEIGRGPWSRSVAVTPRPG